MAIIYGEYDPELHEQYNGLYILKGTDGDDEFYGADVNEILKGYGGNDYYEGGGGYDSIELWGNARSVGLRGLGSRLNVKITDTEILVTSTKSNGESINKTDRIGGGIEEIRVGGSDDDDILIATDVTTMRVVLEGYIGDDYLAGGSFDDGEELDDILSGNTGDDILVGNGGDDALFGGPGNDQLYGGSGNDFLYGDGTAAGIGYAHEYFSPEAVLEYSYPDAESTPDSFFKDAERGNNFDDFLAGHEGNDYLYGGEGNDTLLGGRDSDILIGGSGNDYLLGTDPNNPHAGEVDELTGGTGSDLFLLGNIYTSFYISGNDVAIITDLETASDTVRLHGDASEYQLSATNISINGINGTVLSHRTVVNGLYRMERIAIFDNTWGLSLTDSCFDYVEA